MRSQCRASLGATIVPKELHKQPFPGYRCVTCLDQGPYRCSPRPQGWGLPAPPTGRSPGIWACASAALFGSTYIMLTGIILLWSVSVFHERPSAGLGAAFLLIAVGQVFGALTAGAVAGAAGLVVTFWAFAAIAVVAALISPRVEHPSAA